MGDELWCRRVLAIISGAQHWNRSGNNFFIRKERLHQESNPNLNGDTYLRLNSWLQRKYLSVVAGTSGALLTLLSNIHPSVTICVRNTRRNVRILLNVNVRCTTGNASFLFFRASGLSKRMAHLTEDAHLMWCVTLLAPKLGFYGICGTRASPAQSPVGGGGHGHGIEIGSDNWSL